MPRWRNVKLFCQCRRLKAERGELRGRRPAGLHFGEGQSVPKSQLFFPAETQVQHEY